MIKPQKVRSTLDARLASSSFSTTSKKIFICQLKIINHILVACASATCFCSRRWWASNKRSCLRAANGPARALRSMTLCFNRIFSKFGSDASVCDERFDFRFRGLILIEFEDEQNDIDNNADFNV
jgi:hypothetical protein